jgi:hypothetical protein
MRIRAIDSEEYAVQRTVSVLLPASAMSRDDVISTLFQSETEVEVELPDQPLVQGVVTSARVYPDKDSGEHKMDIEIVETRHVD